MRPAPEKFFRLKKMPGSNTRLQVIRCSRCTNTDNIKVVGPGYPPEALSKKPNFKGWEVGSVRSKDVCPDCLAAKRQLKLVKSEPTTAMSAALEKAINTQSEQPVRVPVNPTVNH